MVTLLYNLPLLAQAATGEPSMLDGYVEVPFAWIGAVVGVISGDGPKTCPAP